MSRGIPPAEGNFACSMLRAMTLNSIGFQFVGDNGFDKSKFTLASKALDLAIPNAEP